jgi:hypothetical protein
VLTSTGDGTFQKGQWSIYLYLWTGMDGYLVPRTTSSSLSGISQALLEMRELWEALGSGRPSAA